MVEKKKVSILKKIDKNILVKTLFFVVSMAVIVGLYAGVNAEIIKNRTVTLDNRIVVGFDDVVTNNKDLQLSGWILRFNSSIKNTSLVLKEVGGTEEVVLTTETLQREDTEEYFNVCWENGISGFKANAKKSKVKNDICYELLLNVEYETDKRMMICKIASGRYLYNGEIFRYNPKTFVEPVVTDEVVKEVIQLGNLLAYDGEKEVWIYEYQSKLYWIIDFELFGTLEERPEIPLFLDTYEMDKLPADKVESGRDYIGYYLTIEDYETMREDKYFIYSMALSTQYLITGMMTGVYQNAGDAEGWIWNTYIMPDIVLP